MTTAQPTDETLIETGLILVELVREMAKFRQSRANLAAAGIRIDQRDWQPVEDVLVQLRAIFGELAQRADSLGIDNTDLVKLMLAIRVPNRVPDDATIDRVQVVLQKIDLAPIPVSPVTLARPPETPPRKRTGRPKGSKKGQLANSAIKFGAALAHHHAYDGKTIENWEPIKSQNELARLAGTGAGGTAKAFSHTWFARNKDGVNGFDQYRLWCKRKDPALLVLIRQLVGESVMRESTYGRDPETRESDE